MEKTGNIARFYRLDNNRVFDINTAVIYNFIPAEIGNSSPELTIIQNRTNQSFLSGDKAVKFFEGLLAECYEVPEDVEDNSTN